MVISKNRLRLCVGLIVCNLAFIWGNSLLTAEISSAISNFVQLILAWLFPGEVTGVTGGGTGLLRKLAHLCEFACLGLLCGWYLLMVKKKLVWAVLPGFCAACVDETIQCFVPGRGPRVTDVLIDTLGVSLGILAIFILHIFIFKIRRKTNEKVDCTLTGNDDAAGSGRL